MALQGKYIHREASLSETEMETVTVTYPTNLSEDHEHYDKRGTSEEIETSKYIITENIYEDCYVIAKAVSTYMLYNNPTEKAYTANAIFRIYNSKEEKDNNWEDGYLLEIIEDFDWDWDTDSNPFVKAYEHFKDKYGAENFTNV
jgi:hypothetical protein